MMSIMYLDLVIYVAIFIGNRVLGLSFLIVMCGAVISNLHGNNIIYYEASMLTVGTMLFFMGKNYRVIGSIFLLKLLIIYLLQLPTYFFVELLLVFQMIVAINTDDQGGNRNLFGKTYGKIKLYSQTNPIHALMHWIHRTSTRRTH